MLGMCAKTQASTWTGSNQILKGIYSNYSQISIGMDFEPGYAKLVVTTAGMKSTARNESI